MHGSATTAEQVIGRLREAEVGLAEGKRAVEMVWELVQLKRVVEALTLDKLILAPVTTPA